MTLNSPWLVTVRPNPLATMRLFCFPYSGGGASVFKQWPNELPNDIEVCAVQLPGRETRLAEPLFTQLNLLIQTMADALYPFLDKPFTFFGHSLGALIAYELTHYLRSTYGIAPLHLIASAHHAPQLPSPLTPIHALPEEEFVAELRRYNGIPEAVLAHAELRELLLPILRADFELFETHEHCEEAPLDCSLSAYGGLSDEGVPHDALAAWQEQTTGPFAMHMLPGDHFFLNSSQPLLLQTVGQELEQTINRIVMRQYL